jgi:hypothetical protein
MASIVFVMGMVDPSRKGGIQTAIKEAADVKLPPASIHFFDLLDGGAWTNCNLHVNDLFESRAQALLNLLRGLWGRHATWLTDSYETLHHPVVLVGHDLGGFLIQQALLYANDRPEFHHALHEHTSIVFCNTPHRIHSEFQGELVRLSCASRIGAWTKPISKSFGLIQLKSNNLLTRFRATSPWRNILSVYDTDLVRTSEADDQSSRLADDIFTLGLSTETKIAVCISPIDVVGSTREAYNTKSPWPFGHLLESGTSSGVWSDLEVWLEDTSAPGCPSMSQKGDQSPRGPYYVLQ